MLTLFGLYVLAIAVGAGCALINDLFFSLSLKHHILKRHEIIALKQLNNLQLVLIIWIVIAEITILALNIQVSGAWYISGANIAKILIELCVLFAALLMRQVHMPALIRYQNTHGHLSDSFLEHNNSLVGTTTWSMVSWFFLVLITSSEFNPRIMDFGFGATILVYAAVSILSIWIVLFLKNSILHRKYKKIR